MRDWLLTRRDFLKSSGLMILFTQGIGRKPRKQRTRLHARMTLLF
jgi:hypothetical protein